MAKKGIQLAFDEHGEPRIAEQPQEDVEECLAGVWCEHARIQMDGEIVQLRCFSNNEPQSPFGMLRCPLNKWGPIEGLGTVEIVPPMYRHDVNRCFSCMTATMWRIKPKKGESDTHWICFNCHPPAPGIPKKKIERRKRSQIKELK